MEKIGITTGKFIAGVVIAILVSSAVSVGISTLLIKGPQGPEGPTGAIGANGATWWNGTGAPSASLGNNGDLYLDLASCDVYNKVSGSWSRVANIQGTIGATGPQGLPGGLSAPNYDSGWVDITGKAGTSFTLTHNLNSTDVMVYVTGLMTQADAPHQFYLGLSSYVSGFEEAYGNTTTDAYDARNSVVQTADGGYAIAGVVHSFVSGDTTSGVYLFKIDAAGAMEWNRTYDGGGMGASLVQTADGGYAIAGTTRLLSTFDDDLLLLKTDASGNLQWNKTYGGTAFDEAMSLVQTTDGGYALAGWTDSYGIGAPTQSNVYLVKTDANGDMEWNQTCGVGIGYSVVQTKDGGYAIAGFTSGVGSSVYLVRTDEAGNVIWNKTYGGGEGLSVVQTKDAGFAVAGFTWVPGYFGDIAYLVKTDAVGVMEWNKTYGEPSTSRAQSVIQTGDGGYAMAGYIWTYGGNTESDIYLVKTDAAGNVQWKKTYGGTRGDFGSSFVQTTDGGYAIVGYTVSFGGNFAQVYLVKTGVESGLAWISTANTVVVYRGQTDVYWNYVRARVWKLG